MYQHHSLLLPLIISILNMKALRGHTFGAPSQQAHGWTYERHVWDYFARAYRTFSSPGSAERCLPPNPCEGGGLGTHPPTRDLSQHTDTGDHRLTKVPPEERLSDDPSLYMLSTYFVSREDLVY